MLQAISLGLFPRLSITFTDKLVEGQIYIGPVRQARGTSLKSSLPACLHGTQSSLPACLLSQLRDVHVP